MGVGVSDSWLVDYEDEDDSRPHGQGPGDGEIGDDDGTQSTGQKTESSGGGYPEI